MTRQLTSALAIAAAVMLPLTVAAQQPAGVSQPLRIEPMDNGFVVAPDAKLTTVNDQTATLAGVYGGWLTDRTLLVGGGAYWLANRERDFKMQYAGAIGRWTIGGHRRLGVSAGALVGLGDATLSRPYGDLFDDRLASESSNARHFRPEGRSPISSATPVVIADNYFITEPQLNALWRLTGWMRLDAGVTYRFIAGAPLLDDELRGVSGRIALQLGR